MVTLQILVLPFLVRVRVAQQQRETLARLSFFMPGYPDSLPFYLFFQFGVVEV